MTVLVNELAWAPGEVVLVLDDYHLITAAAVHESVVFLLEHLPAGLRLAMACCADPPLPLAELRADREVQVLALLAAGVPNQQIAGELVAALETAKKHVSHILGKLGAANRTQAVARAHALGLLR